MSFYTDAWWQHANRNERVAVIVGNEPAKFMSLVEFATANREALDEMVSNAEGHDVTARIFTDDELILGGGAAPLIRVTPAIRCKTCGVEMVEFAHADGCEDPNCDAQARGREIERLCMGASA